MAGYDFRVRVENDAEGQLVRAALSGLQLRARQRWVTVHYRRSDDGYLVTVDGPLVNIQASREPLAIALGAIADATPVAMPRARRLQIVRRVLRGYVRGAWDITTIVLDTAHDMGSTPNSYVFDAVGDELVQHHLDALTTMLETWQNEGTATELALEALHAVAEMLMGVELGPDWDDRTFVSQADEMLRRGCLSVEQHRAVIELKDRRRTVRHHLGTMSRAELRDRLPRVLEALHRMVDVRAAEL